ncbi:hypothetical protein [Dongia sp. agr-C8]
MLALAEIIGLIILNALLHAAFTRWRLARRIRSPKRSAGLRPSAHYPMHPSPVAGALAPEQAVLVRPAGTDW